MTAILLPAPPLIRFGVVVGPVWTVVRDGVAIGEIRQHETDGVPWYSWRVSGGWWIPTRTGMWWITVAAVEREADRPMAARRGIPAELKIAGLMKEQARKEAER